MRWYYYKATGGETEINTSLSGEEINEVFRDGSENRVILEGTPIGKEVRFESDSGKFIFGYPLNPDEAVDISYKYDNLLN